MPYQLYFPNKMRDSRRNLESLVLERFDVYSMGVRKMQNIVTFCFGIISLKVYTWK